VTLVDAKILIYATDPRSERHEQARSWLDRQLSGDTRVGTAWENLLAYVRIVANPRVFERPQSVVWRHAEEWLDCENAPAIEHGLALCSTDGDSARFKGLRRINPLAA
jgi:predicted nucleic acid-binding protein